VKPEEGAIEEGQREYQEKKMLDQICLLEEK